MVLRNCYLTILFFTFCSCSDQSKWDSYVDDKGQYKIEFQGKPTIKIYQQQFPFANVTWTNAIIEKPDKNNLSYLVKYADFPENIITSDSLRILQDFFLFVQSDLAQSLGETGLDNINLKAIQKYPGREFRWKDNLNKLGYTRRMFLVRNRLYFLEVKYKLENDFNNDIEGFLDKFALLKTADNQNPEILAERPVKKFEARFPGPTTISDNPAFHELFGNVYGLLEAYEVPRDQRNLPTVKNILYGVSYARLPTDKIKGISEQRLREFVTTTFTDNIEKQPKGKILLQREISLAGNWGIEGQGIMLDGMAVMHLRAFIVDDYYYQVVVMSKNGTQNNQEALAFLNSFRLTND